MARALITFKLEGEVIFFYQTQLYTTYMLFIRQSRDCRIMWLGMAGVDTGFRTITLVLYIGSLPSLATWFPCGRGRTVFILGSKVKVTVTIQFCKYNFWQQDRFRITLVLYIGSLPNFGHMIPLWKGKNPIYFGVIRSKVKVTITINRIFDNRIVSAR